MYVSKSRVASICFVPVSVFLLTCGTTYVVLIPSLGIESSVLMQCKWPGEMVRLVGEVVYVFRRVPFSLWLRDGMGMDMQLGEAISRCSFCEFGRLMTARYCRPDL
jgi:hypothetical protein